MPFPPISQVPLLVPPLGGQGLRFSQATVLTWNSSTFENSLSWEGVTLFDVPVLSGPDALTYQTGDVVGLLGWNPGGGTGSWWIVGRIIVPGAGAGEIAIDWMTSALGRAVSAAVFSDQIYADTVLPQEFRTNTSFGDLATEGPEVADVEVTETGRMLVIVSAQMFAIAEAGNSQAAFMSYQIDGPDDRSPSVPRSAQVGISVAGEFSTAFDRSSGVFLEEGLTPGSYAVQAKYASNTTGGSNQTSWSDRNLIVISF